MDSSEAPTTSAAAAVSGAVERLVAAAAAEVESAAQRIRAEAQIETARLQALIDQLRGELAEERDKLKIAFEEASGLKQQLATDHEEASGLRQQLATGLEEASGLKQQLATALEEGSGLKRQLAMALEESSGLKQRLAMALEEGSRLKLQLAAEHSERTKLIDALHTVQRAVSFTDPIVPKPDPTPVPTAVEAEDRPAAPNVATDALSVNRLLKLVTNTRAADAESHPELLEYVKQLLAEMETIYWADLRSEANAADVVDRLTANLRYARDVFTRRLATYDGGEPALFEQQIAILLDSKPETSFARHLAIAAYEYSLSQSTRPQHRAEAS